MGIRNSQKRLESLITETAVQPIEEFDSELRDNFDLVEAIIRLRTARVIAHWSRNKHDPVAPRVNDKMGDITNASKHDVTLAQFYTNEVKSALQSLVLPLGIDVPADYQPRLDYLADALNDLGSQPELMTEEEEDEDILDNNDMSVDDDEYSLDAMMNTIEDQPPVDLSQITLEDEGQFTELEKLVAYEEVIEEKMEERMEQERAIVASNQNQVIEIKEKHLPDNVLAITAQEAWEMIYGLIGYQSDYIQTAMLPRWQQNPAAFDKDRRYLYGLFIDTLRNASGIQNIAGHYTFRDGRRTLDMLWTHYYSDLSQNVAPQLAAAKLHNDVNDPWYKKLRQTVQEELGRISPIWLIALGIAMVLDALTTYISLDQTPMEGPMVLMFTVLITALFQIADQLVISYRKREFEAEAMAAKYQAQYQGLMQEVSKLAISSESYVQLSMNKSKSHADWKAAEDNRKMARRGRFWTARIADINVVVTAYGLSYLFLNAREPMEAIVEQLEIIFVRNDFKNIDPWIFLMVALSITVSFVINTAQRTEILSWSMRRLKQEA